MKMTAVAAFALTRVLFQQLYQRHSGQLCAYLTRSVRGNRAEAESIVQETFLRAWEKRDSLRDIEAFRPWIYSIALNVLRQRKRRLRPLAVEGIETACERPSPERHAAASQELDRVLAALDRLPHVQREAIILVRMENMKFSEAAQVLAVPENTVKTRVRRGLLALAEELDL